MKILAATPANRKFLYGIIFAAALLRLGAVVLFNPPLISDDKDYDALSHPIVRGDGFQLEGKPSAYRLPGYPLIVAGTYALFGGSKTPVRILQAIADVFSCLLLFTIGKKLFSEKVGLTAAAILAVFPIHILYVSHIMTETIFMTFFLLIIWIVVNEEKGTYRLGSNVLLGVLIGVGTLMRTTAALLPLIIFLHRWKGGNSFNTNVRSLLVVSMMAFLVVSPWLIRNYKQFQRVSLTSNTGINFWTGNHAGAGGGYSFPKENNPLAAIDDDFERSDLGIKLGIEFIKTQPLEYCILLGKKFVRFFSPDYWLMMTMEYRPEWASATNAATIFSQLSLFNIIVLHLPYVVVLFLGTFGLVCNAGEDAKDFFFMRSLLLYWLTVHLIFYADARYRFPIVPMLILGAAYGWYILRENLFQRTKLRLALFAILCLLFIGGWIGEYLTIRSKMILIQPRSEEISPGNRRFADTPTYQDNLLGQKFVDFIAPLEYI